MIIDEAVCFLEGEDANSFPTISSIDFLPACHSHNYFCLFFAIKILDLLPNSRSSETLNFTLPPVSLLYLLKAVRVTLLKFSLN